LFLDFICISVFLSGFVVALLYNSIWFCFDWFGFVFALPFSDFPD